jgi:hypothetical protein
MTVEELRALLKDLDGEMIVVLSSDGEGNRFAEVGGYNTENYAFDDYNEDLVEISQEVARDATRCVVLWPDN